MDTNTREPYGSESTTANANTIVPAADVTDISRLLTLAADAVGAGDFSQAQRYVDEAIALDDTDPLAWELRAATAAGKQGPSVLRMEEAVNAWITAERASAPVDAPALRERIADRFVSLYLDELKAPASHFSAAPNDDDLQRILQTFSTGLQLLNTLTGEAGVVFSCGPLFNRIARLFTDAAANGYHAAAADFGPAHNNMLIWQWEKYTEAGDRCLRLLEKAVRCCRDNALGKRICDLYISIAQSVRDSCAWKYDTADAQNPDFVQDISFSNEAKRIRTEDVKTIRSLRGYFEADQTSRLYKDLEADRAGEDASRGMEHYWREHASQAADFEKEAQALNLAVHNAQDQMQTLPVSAEITRIRNERAELQNRISALGFGKRKQKQELRHNAEALSLCLTELEEKEAEQKKALSWTIKKSNARIAEIRRILAAPRGSLPAPAGAYTLRGINGAMPSPQALFEHFSDILRAPYRADQLCRTDPSLLPEAFSHLNACWQCVIRKDSVDLSKQTCDVSLFFFADSQSAPLTSALLLATDAVDADETDLHDFAYIGACLLLSLLSSLSQPEAEKTILALRHGNVDTVFSEGALRCVFTCSERTNTDGYTQIHDIILYQTIQTTPADNM